MDTPRSGREEEPQWPLARPQAKCEENEKGAEEDALKTILKENGCRRKYTFIPAENTQFRVGGHIDAHLPGAGYQRSTGRQQKTHRLTREIPENSATEN